MVAFTISSTPTDVAFRQCRPGERQQLLGTSVSLAEPGADGSCKGQGPWAQEQRKVNAGLGPCVVRGREPRQDLLLSGLPNRQVLLGRRDDDSY